MSQTGAVAVNPSRMGAGTRLFVMVEEPLIFADGAVTVQLIVVPKSVIEVTI